MYEAGRPSNYFFNSFTHYQTKGVTCIHFKKNKPESVVKVKQFHLHTCLGCCCNPILVKRFLEWLSGTEPCPRTPGTERPSSLCLRCILRAHVQFCLFDKADATSDVQ